MSCRARVLFKTQSNRMKVKVKNIRSTCYCRISSQCLAILAQDMFSILAWWLIVVPYIFRFASGDELASTLKLEEACPCSPTCQLPTTTSLARASMGPPSSLVIRQAVRPPNIDQLPPCPDLQTRCCWSYDLPSHLPDTGEPQLEEQTRQEDGDSHNRQPDRQLLVQLTEEVHEEEPDVSLRRELALAKLQLMALRRDVVQNLHEFHSRPRPVGEGTRQLACVERCPGEVRLFKEFHVLIILSAGVGEPGGAL